MLMIFIMSPFINIKAIGTDEYLLDEYLINESLIDESLVNDIFEELYHNEEYYEPRLSTDYNVHKTNFETTNSNSNVDYGIVIDAGSTGTRLHVYQWTKRQNTTSLAKPVPVTNRSSIAVRPGISQGNPEVIYSTFRTIIKFAVNLLKSQGVTNKTMTQIPLFFGATAGIRGLSEYRRDEIMTLVRDFFNNHTESPFRIEVMRTLSGEEEGVFGWLSVNYLMGDLDNQTETIGAMDMGGASTQITFAPVGEVLANFFPINTNKQMRAYRLYTRSFQKFGMVELKKQLNSEVVLQYGSQHPCLPLGYTVYDPIEEIQFYGTSQSKNCTDLILDLLHISQPCWLDHCSINGAYQPQIPSNTKFVAFSAYPLIVRSLKLPNDVAPSDLLDKAWTVCELDYEQLNRTYGPNDYLMSLCADSMYIGLLLNYGYSMSDSKILFLERYNSTEIEWTFGAMLYYANQLPLQVIKDPTVPTKQSNDTTLVLVTSLGSAVCLVIVFWLYYYSRRKTIYDENRQTEQTEQFIKINNML
jgi:hypothetical protein